MNHEEIDNQDLAEYIVSDGEDENVLQRELQHLTQDGYINSEPETIINNGYENMDDYTQNSSVNNSDINRAIAGLHPNYNSSEVDYAMSVVSATLSGTHDGESNIVYGTNIDHEDTLFQISNFLTTFTNNTGEVHYSRMILECINKGLNTIQVDMGHLREYTGPSGGVAQNSIHQKIIEFPSEMMVLFDAAISSIADHHIGTTNREGLDISVPQSSFKGLPSSRIYNVRSLDPKHIEQLIAVKGVIIRTGDLIPDMQDALFQCTSPGCSFFVWVKLDEGIVHDEPTRCQSCEGTKTFKLQNSSSRFVDRQTIKLQEPPENIPEGETPQTIEVILYEHLYDQIKPGTRVLISGIYKAHGSRLNKNTNQLHTTYITCMEAIHIDILSESKHSHSDNMQDIETTDNFEEVEKFHKMIHDMTPDQIRKKLISSFAPSIFEYEDVKLGLLCQLLAGTESHATEKRIHRSQINVLMCGDPSTAKSQLLKYVHELSPRGIYTSGKGSSAVGLTASVTRDPDTKDLVLQSGALVLSDRGICAIDEFDKMDDTTRTILHETLEQQTISLAKAGVICTLNARTAICACANPIGSRYNSQLSVVQNINLAPSLMSRFDLIFLILDKGDEDTDYRLAKHLIKQYTESVQEVEPPLSKEELKEFISYARFNCWPCITTETSDALKKAYLQLRTSAGNSKVCNATVRQLESIIRLSEALAKMELSNLVRPDHVAEALRIIKVSTYSAATDPRTGKIDMSILTHGISTDSRVRYNAITEKITEILYSNNQREVRAAEIFASLNADKAMQQASYIFHSESEFLDIVNDLERLNFISIKRRLAGMEMGISLVKVNND